MEDGGSAGGAGTYFSAGGSGASASTQSRYDSAGRAGDTGTDGEWLGYTDAGIHYQVSGAPASIPGGECVIAIVRTATHAKLRVISGGAVVYSNDVASTVHVPDHLAIAAKCGTNGAIFSQRGPVDYISSIVSSAEVSDAELIAWAAARDARSHVSGIKSYHVASQAVGASIADLGANGVAMALTAASASDLVALQEPVTSYYSSPGGAGDYAEASTNVAARVLVPLGAPSDCTYAAWHRVPATWGNLFTASDGSGTGAGFNSYNDGDLALGVTDDAGNEDVTAYATSPAVDAWVRIAYVIDAGATLKTYVDGTEVSSESIVGWTPVTGGASRFRLFKAASGYEVEGRNISINDRAHTAGEEAALYAAGPTHHPLMPAGVWAGGQSIPVIWCTPAVGVVVANSGDGGTCNLVLSGAVTSEVD